MRPLPSWFAIVLALGGCDSALLSPPDAAPDAAPPSGETDASPAGPTGGTYYVNSSTGNDARDGRSAQTAWRTMARVNAATFAAGDVVHLYGTLTDQPIGNPGSGTAAAPITLIGDGPFDGRARVAAIGLTAAEHVVFQNLEASGANQTLVGLSGTRPVRFVRFENLLLHDGNYGVLVSSAAATDVTFVATVIRGTYMDGVLLNDAAGDRFSFIGGSITDTGQRGYQPHWALHGVYASGGHGHLFDGVEFARNGGGSGLSLRRGDSTVRNCVFRGGTEMLNYNNEDPSGTRRTLLVYRNLFIGDGASTAIYHGGNNDTGVDDPANRWVVFNNTFVNAAVNFSASGTAGFYDIYLRNNLFAGSRLTVVAPAAGHLRALSNNGFWNAGTPQGTANVLSDPQLDAADDVTAAAQRDHGVTAIAPAVSLVPQAANPLGYVGAAPDIGRTER